MIVNCEIGAGATIGPFAHLREGAVIEPAARIGNFVEVKKSTIGRGAKALHLTYLGDATVGERANIGAGTITCNYDGEKKNPTTIEDGVFIGSGNMLVAPVRIGKGSYTAAGSTITEDVPPDSLAIARGHQVNKEGWARERRKAEGPRQEVGGRAHAGLETVPGHHGGRTFYLCRVRNTNHTTVNFAIVRNNYFKINKLV